MNSRLQQNSRLQLAFLACLSLFGIVACQTFTAKEMFERVMNDVIGKKIEASWYRDPAYKVPVNDGSVEYVFVDHKTGCKWAFLADERKGIFLSWRYLSDPSLCRLDTSFTP